MSSRVFLDCHIKLLTWFYIIKSAGTLLPFQAELSPFLLCWKKLIKYYKEINIFKITSVSFISPRNPFLFGIILVRIFGYLFHLETSVMIYIGDINEEYVFIRGRASNK